MGTTYVHDLPTIVVTNPGPLIQPATYLGPPVVCGVSTSRQGDKVHLWDARVSSCLPSTLHPLAFSLNRAQAPQRGPHPLGLCLPHSEHPSPCLHLSPDLFEVPEPPCLGSGDCQGPRWGQGQLSEFLGPSRRGDEAA